MKFLSRSILILLALYGLVFAIGDVYLAREGAPLGVAVVFAVVFIAIQFLIAPWAIEWLLTICWDDMYREVPARNIEFIQQLCEKRKLKMPRIGVIRSGTPNAFCFGHHPGDARLIVTTGLLEILTPEETNAVLAHELGHIEHWDFVVMTFASLAPLLLYQLYAFTDRLSNTRAIAYAAYFSYLLSQFVVLLLNRTREYFADHYSAEVTGDPSALSSALVKIAYGMVKAEGDYQYELKEGDKSEARRNRRLSGSMAVMGISNFRSGTALALGGSNPAAAAAVMRWDLVNPWARLYELNSTHPLTALRVRELNEQAENQHQAVQYPLPEDRRIHWGLFPIEFVIWVTPWISLAALAIEAWHEEWLSYLGITLPAHAKPVLLMIAGASFIAKITYRYRGQFAPATVGSLIEDVDVSQMRPRGVELRGEIVGRGLPGAFWSPDLVLRDETGIIFMLYRQSIPFARFLFGYMSADKFIGEQVVLQGWFRRGLRPYVEMASIKTNDGAVSRSYSRWVQYAASGMAVVIGLLWLVQ